MTLTRRELGSKFKNFFTFSRAEMRGVLWLLPLLAVVAVILTFANRPRFEKSFVQQVEETASAATTRYTPTPAPEIPRTYAPRRESRMPRAIATFDPNALDVDGFVALGVFSRRQAEVIVKYRASIGGFRTVEDFAKCYVVSDGTMELLKDKIVIAAPKTIPAERVLVELNTADSTTLRTVSGIGDKLVVRILDYRERLGGFVSAGQLHEIPGMYPENFERIATQISVDSCIIRKIDINFASPEALGKHPYITAEGLRKILKHRQLKGGWRTTEELINENILTQQQAEKLAPYLIFN